MIGTWSLLAESGDGPNIPILPMVAALRALANGRLAPGARACAGCLTLVEIEREFAPYHITTRLHRAEPPPSLYQTVLGKDFALLPAAVRRMHQPDGFLKAKGVAQVDGAATLVGHVAAFAFGFPAPSPASPLQLRIQPRGDAERWVRCFGATRFASTLSAARRPGHIVERFGPLRFELHVPAGIQGVLGMDVVAWWLGPLPLPPVCAPISRAREWEAADGRFHFDVEVRLPFNLGRIVRYRGWLVPVTSSSQENS